MTLQGINDAKHWRDRAAEMRVLSDVMKDQESQRMMLKLANDYDQPTELKIARRAMGRRGQARSRKPDKGFCEDLASPAPDRLRGRQTRWPIQSEYGVRPAYGRLSLQSDGAVPRNLMMKSK